MPVTSAACEYSPRVCQRIANDSGVHPFTSATRSLTAPPPSHLPSSIFHLPASATAEAPRNSPAHHRDPQQAPDPPDCHRAHKPSPPPPPPTTHSLRSPSNTPPQPEQAGERETHSPAPLPQVARDYIPREHPREIRLCQSATCEPCSHVIIPRAPAPFPFPASIPGKLSSRGGAETRRPGRGVSFSAFSPATFVPSHLPTFPLFHHLTSPAPSSPRPRTPTTAVSPAAALSPPPQSQAERQ